MNIPVPTQKEFIFSFLTITDPFPAIRKSWCESFAVGHFSHRTDPKPRPEGYRDPSPFPHPPVLKTILQKVFTETDKLRLRTRFPEAYHDAQNSSHVYQEGPSEAPGVSGPHPSPQKGCYTDSQGQERPSL